MRTRLLLVLTLLCPLVAISGATVTQFHVERVISQQFPAPACLGLPAGAVIDEDFVQAAEVKEINNGNIFTFVAVVESNGVASATDGAWLWDIRLHRTDSSTERLGANGYRQILRSNRHFISKQPGVPNLHRTAEFTLIINANGELVVDPGLEVDFVCSP